MTDRGRPAHAGGHCAVCNATYTNVRTISKRRCPQYVACMPHAVNAPCACHVLLSTMCTPPPAVTCDGARGGAVKPHPLSLPPTHPPTRTLARHFASQRVAAYRRHTTAHYDRTHYPARVRYGIVSRSPQPHRPTHRLSPDGKKCVLIAIGTLCLVAIGGFEVRTSRRRPLSFAIFLL